MVKLIKEDSKSTALKSRLFFLFFLLSAIVSAQSTVDSLKMRLYIADGFRDENISIYLNNKAIFLDVNIKSNAIYSLTGLSFDLYADSSDNSNWILETNLKDSLSHSSIPIKKNIKLKVENSNKKYKFKIRLIDGTYFVLYKKTDIIYLEQFKNQPGFD
jgi:hypothetical protein